MPSIPTAPPTTENRIDQQQMNDHLMRWQWAAVAGGCVDTGYSEKHEFVIVSCAMYARAVN